MTELKKYEIFINGEWKKPNSGEYLKSYYPFTGKEWALIPRCNETDANLAVSAAKQAMEADEWRSLMQHNAVICCVDWAI